MSLTPFECLIFGEYLRGGGFSKNGKGDEKPPAQEGEGTEAQSVEWEPRKPKEAASAEDPSPG